MAEGIRAELLPELIPTSLSGSYDPEFVSEMMHIDRYGSHSRGVDITPAMRQVIDNMKSTWEAGDIGTFDQVSARLYPSLEEPVATAQGYFSRAGEWWRRPSTQDAPRTDTPVQIGSKEFFSAMGNIGLGAAEIPVMLASGLADLGRGGYVWAKESIRSKNPNNTWLKAMQEATQVWEARQGNWVYAPKTYSGEGISAIISSPFLAWDHLATKSGEGVERGMGGRFRRDSDAPTALEMSRMKALFDTALALRENGQELPPDQQQELDAIRERFEGGIPADVEINYPALFAGYGVKMLVNLIPDMATGGRAWATQNAAQRRVELGLRHLGIDPYDSAGRQIMQRYQYAAGRASGSQAYKHENMLMVQQGLRDAMASRRRITRRLYEEAKSGKAAVATDVLKRYSNSVYDLFDPNTSTFDLTAMPLLNNRLKQLSRMVDDVPPSWTAGTVQSLGRTRTVMEHVPGTKAPVETTINQLSTFRKAINASIKSSANPSEKAALMILKDSLDNNLNDWFTSDLISGDATAIAKWKKANDFRREFAVDFDEKKLLKKLVENDLTQTEIRRLLFGLSESGMAPQSARVIREIRRANPKNADEIIGYIRNDLLLDTVQPLLQAADTGAMDIQGFLRNYNKRFGSRQDSELMMELFPDRAGLEHMDNLAAHARASMAAVGSRVSNLDAVSGQSVTSGRSNAVTRGLAVVLFGHDIAQQAMKVRIADQIFRGLAGTGGNVNIQKRIIEEITGQPYRSRFPIRHFKDLPEYAIGVELFTNSPEQGGGYIPEGGTTPFEGLLEQGANIETPFMSEEARDWFRRRPNL